MIIKTVLILCGGKGTRLGAIGKKTQKLLLKCRANQSYGILLKF